MPHLIHQSPEERLSNSSEKTAGLMAHHVEVLKENMAVLREVEKGVKDRDHALLIAKQLEKSNELLKAIKDPKPEDVVRKLEEVKSATLIANKLLKEIKAGVARQMPDVIFPKDIGFSLEGVETVTLKGAKGDRGDDGKDSTVPGPKGDDGKDSTVPGPKGDRGDDGKDSTVPGPKGEPGINGSPDTPDEVVDKVNKADKKIEPKQVKNLLQMLQEAGSSGGGGGGQQFRVLASGTEVSAHVTELNFDSSVNLTYDGSGRITITSASPLTYDISDQFDGVTDTFTIPTYSAVRLFIITGWPPNGVLRPTTDFTTPSTTTVQLTSEVSAPEAGTSGIILYIP